MTGQPAPSTGHAPRLAVGTRLRLAVGAVAHGGHCVARVDPASGAPPGHEGRVVFVRHTLPGETVVAVVTEDGGGSFLRADAVDVEVAAVGRVAPPCPAARPGRCGGCDWQHADASTQLALKTDVVRESLRRFAGLDLDVRVEPLPGGPLGWRTTTSFAVDRSVDPPRLGLRRHRSHDVEPVADCPISVPAIATAPSTRADVAPGLRAVEYVVGDGPTLTAVGRRPAPRQRHRRRRDPDVTAVLAGPPDVRHDVGGRTFTVAATGFWQVHPAAAETFVAAVIAGLDPGPGETALDLYAGAGLFTASLAAVTGGRTLGLEADAHAVSDAGRNLTGLPGAEVRRERVSAATVTAAAEQLGGAGGAGGAAGAGGIDLVVLDPPRTGAGPDVVAAVAAAGPRAVAYVACDPVALARDLAAFAAAGYRLASLRAFDAFPMTHHVECVAVCERGVPS